MDQGATLGRLLLQRPQRLAIAGQLRRQHLDRDPGFGAARFGKPPVQCLVDDAHGTAADTLLQHEPVSQHRTNLHTRVRIGRPRYIILGEHHRRTHRIVDRCFLLRRRRPR